MKKRLFKYEAIRVIAMFLVVTLHQLGFYGKQNSFFFINSVLFSILCVCIPLFFMLSGKFAFNIDYEDENYLTNYYKKKFLNLILPIFIYMLIKEAYILFVLKKLEIVNAFTIVKDIIYNVLYGFSISEYWFFYALIINILVVPFIGKFIVNASKKEASIFIGICLIFNVISTCLGYFSYEVHHPFAFSGFSIFFYLGYFIEKHFNDEKDIRRIYTLGIISFVVNLLLMIFTKGINTNGYSIFYTCFAVSVFVFLRENIKKIRILENFIIFVGKYSFAIWMLHMMFLEQFNLYIPVGNMNTYVYSFILIVLTIISSLACGFVIDNTIIKYGKKFFEKVLTKKKKTVI